MLTDFFHTKTVWCKKAFVWKQIQGQRLLYFNVAPSGGNTCKVCSISPFTVYLTKIHWVVFEKKNLKSPLLCRVVLLVIMGKPFVLANQISACRVTWAISSESSTVIGAFTLNGRAKVVDNRGLCIVISLTSWVPVCQLVHVFWV